IIQIWQGGIGLWGGILGGFLGGAAYALWAKHPVGAIADLTAPAMLFVQSIGRVGDFVNGEHCAGRSDAFGFVWTNPASDARACENGVGIAVHPVIFYEVMWNMIALAIIWKPRGRLRPDGMLFALYLVLYSIGRFGIQFLRQDEVKVASLQEAHFIALIVLAITIPLLIWKARPRSEADMILEGSAPPPRQRGTRAERRRRPR
ncbi:MAG: prolipoprotein diacylglyceryl transferase, partial [Ardenticatenaceae bacterium]